MGVALTEKRAIAVDKSVYGLGLPVWIDVETSSGRVAKLTMAQDVGAAIKGAQRADIFFGSGDAAGKAAGSVKDRGAMVALIPRLVANRIWREPSV